MTEPFQRDVYCVLGLPFDAIGVERAAHQIARGIERREPCFLSTPNVNWIVASRIDEALRDSVIDSDMSVADGLPIVWVARWLGIPIRERAAGSSIFQYLEAGQQFPIKVYFFGGAEGAAQAACAGLNARSAGLRCVGSYNPGFGTVEEMSGEPVIARINASGAEFVVVSLGARKGQAWILANRHRLSAPMVSHLGAVVNFVARTTRRAPLWMQRWGFEWLWRIREEKSLWRRYLSDGCVLLRLLMTRVLPYAWLLALRRVTAQEPQPPTLLVGEEDATVTITLGGAWTRETLEPLRECFARASGASQDTRLDMRRVTVVDSGFVGLVQLLQGDCRRRGGRLVIERVTPRVRRIFRYLCADYLLQLNHVQVSPDE